MSVELLGEEFTKTAQESLEESLEYFRDAHRKNSDEILNITEKRKKNAARVYVYRPYPKMTYHADGREVVIFSEEELESQTDLGFRTTPYIRPRVVVLSPAEEKASADKRFKEQEEMIRQLSDTLARMQISQEAAAVSKKK